MEKHGSGGGSFHSTGGNSDRTLSAFGPLHVSYHSVGKTGKRTLMTFSGWCLLPKEEAQIAKDASELVQEGQSGNKQCQAEYLVCE